jgi:hypothetical protein
VQVIHVGFLEFVHQHGRVIRWSIYAIQWQAFSGLMLYGNLADFWSKRRDEQQTRNGAEPRLKLSEFNPI